MAEFADLGAHCYYDLCRQQSFLPFDCDYCKKTFCEHHRIPKDHQCKRIPKQQNYVKKSKKKKKFKCKVNGCKAKTLMLLICAKCNGGFCTNHRHCDLHNCPKDVTQNKDNNIDQNLEPFVNTLNILNYDRDCSTISHIYQTLLPSDRAKSDSYIVSNCDEEILFLIEFSQQIELDTMIIHALPSIRGTRLSQPRMIHIYKADNISLSFDDVSSMKPDKSIECEVNGLREGQTVTFSNDIQTAIKFKKVRCLVIYVKSNQDGIKQTFLNGITMKGRVKQQHIDTDAFDPVGFWKRRMQDKDIKSDLSQSRVAQTHLSIIRSKYFQCVNYEAIKIDHTLMIPLTTNDQTLFTKITSKTGRGATVLNTFIKSGVIQKILHDYKYKNGNTLNEIIEQQTQDIVNKCSNYWTSGLCKQTRIGSKMTSRIYIYIGRQSDMDILSTLIHELAHMGTHGHGKEFTTNQAKIGHFVYENITKKTTFYKKGKQILPSITKNKKRNDKKRSIHIMMNGAVHQPNPKKQKRETRNPNYELDTKRMIMINQLVTFGYKQRDIALAIKAVNDTNDINQIMDELEKQEMQRKSNAKKKKLKRDSKRDVIVPPAPINTRRDVALSSNRIGNTTNGYVNNLFYADSSTSSHAISQKPIQPLPQTPIKSESVSTRNLNHSVLTRQHTKRVPITDRYIPTPQRKRTGLCNKPRRRTQHSYHHVDQTSGGSFKAKEIHDEGYRAFWKSYSTRSCNPVGNRMMNPHTKTKCESNSTISNDKRNYLQREHPYDSHSGIARMQNRETNRAASFKHDLIGDFPNNTHVHNPSQPSANVHINASNDAVSNMLRVSNSLQCAADRQNASALYPSIEHTHHSQQINGNIPYQRSKNFKYFDALVCVILMFILFGILYYGKGIGSLLFSTFLSGFLFVVIKCCIIVKEYGIYGLILLLCVRMFNYKVQ